MSSVTAAARTAGEPAASARSARSASSPASAAAAYTASHLSVLEGLEAVRKRPGMYIGSTDGRGLQHCLWEIFDNSVDEALGGHCTRIEVILHADGSAEVRDNGRGIPVDTERKTRLSGVELVLTRLHAGGKFGGGSYTASGGLHGVGASVVNALSARLDIEVDREGHTWATSFRRGVAGEFAAEGPSASFTKRSGLQKAATIAARKTGTRIRFWPDRQVFLRDATFNYRPDIRTLCLRAAFVDCLVRASLDGEETIVWPKPLRPVLDEALRASTSCETWKLPWRTRPRRRSSSTTSPPRCPTCRPRCCRTSTGSR